MILEFPILFGGVSIATTTYRVYYAKLHFFYNMDRSLLDTKFRYKVEFSTRFKISGTDSSKNSSRFGHSFCANLSGSFFCLN